jgi:hypothetical protein
MSDSAGGLGDVRNLLGFLVAGFAGALNIIGIKSTEIGVVLRNEPVGISIVTALLVAGLLAAVVSIFVESEKHLISLITACVVFLLLVSLFLFTARFIPSPFPGHDFEHAASLWFGLAVLLIAVMLGAWTRYGRLIGDKIMQRADARKPVAGNAGKRVGRFLRDSDPGKINVPGKFPDLLNLQCLLLGAAVMLTSTAAYGALRLETISQAATVAEISDSLRMSGQNDILAISLSASKLSTKEWLGINVIAVPRSWHIASLCRDPRAQQIQVDATCAQNPCYYFSAALNKSCIELSEDIISPDASGGVRRTIEIPFSAAKFQHVQITANSCEPLETDVPNGTCEPIGAASRLDIGIPASARGARH